ncbi:hypothetical protein [Pseudomonas sp.]|uniref:hypothetical protein n=1 Tax=Pseudomonas sp. TaxID=306 RepID=UPI0032633F42
MSQFKQGDLALIVGSSCTVNIGKTVRLVEFVPVGGVPIVNGQAYTPRLHPTWVVETPDGASSLIVPRATTGRLQSVSVGACRESWLMPLRGDFTPERQKSREVVA